MFGLRYLTAIDPSCSGGIVAVLAPGRMIEMNHRVTIPRCDGIIERQAADLAPIAERPSLPKRRAGGPSNIRDLYIKCQLAFGNRITAVEYLRHDLVAEVQVIPRSPRLFGGDN